MVFPATPKPASRDTTRAKRSRPRQDRQAPPINSTMTCEVAFRTIAGHYLAELTMQYRATCVGDASALHEMRIALTRLRTTIIFFLPIVAGPQQMHLADELKWLNAHLGVVRDLDVAIERLMAVKKKRPQKAPGRRSAERNPSDGALVR
jgi:CHAD domain-containing protein